MDVIHSKQHNYRIFPFSVIYIISIIITIISGSFIASFSRSKLDLGNGLLTDMMLCFNTLFVYGCRSLNDMRRLKQAKSLFTD